MKLLLLLIVLPWQLQAADLFKPVLAHPHGALAPLDPKKSPDLNEILDRVSAALLGKKYQLGPLGEGDDAAHPLYRLDIFDCTTFLETVMANAYCFSAGERRPDCLAKSMQKIRYGGGQISFLERNHIPELDWLPHNVSHGFLEDLSTSFHPSEWHTALITIDRDLWMASLGKTAKTKEPAPARTLAYLPVAHFFTKSQPDVLLADKFAAMEKEIAAKMAAPGISKDEREQLTKEKFRVEMEFLKLEFVPLEDRLKEIPSGTVLNLVRAAVTDAAKAKLTPLISHQGLILQKSDGPHIRHAAANVGHVSDQRLADYLLRYVKSSNVRGISLYRILQK